MAGCATNDDDAAEHVHSYTVRGEIYQLPNPSRPDGSDIYLRHEAIPDFVDAQGEAVGMAAMTMGFPLGPKVNLSGLAAGDPVVFDLEVRWQGTPAVLVTRLERIELGPTPDPADAPEGSETEPASTAGGEDVASPAAAPAADQPHSHAPSH